METPTDHSFNIPSALRPSSPTTDHLSLALNDLSQLPTIRRFDVGDYDFVLSPALFWPDNDVFSIKHDSPFWPSLKHVHVVAGPCTPTGGWYYDRDPLAPPPPQNDDPDPGNDTEASAGVLERRFAGNRRFNQFLTVLSPATFNPLALSFARAVTRMPKLLEFSFKISTADCYSQLQANWFRAGIPLPIDSIHELGDEEKNRWLISVDERARWKAPAKLMELLREGVGEEGVVRVQTRGRKK
ncbi:hypothetical protein BDZ91DRAFT_730362 [Kalaharituber pfeilii]|nr:hypothetical protein BDZ91DRAFT_730362 [Kalaharituber pfeilii]